MAHGLLDTGMAREPRTVPAGVEADDGTGYGERDGSESQGRFSGEGYGDDAQGEYGDEDGDPSYDELTDGEADGPVGQDVVARRAMRRQQQGPPSDASLEEEVADALVERLALDPADFVVRVTDGVVALDGWVDTMTLREAAERLVFEVVPGVRGMENHLRQRRGATEEP